MSTQPIHDGFQLDRTGAARPARSEASAPARASGGTPAFRALLEELQAQARRLDETSRSVDAPEHLAGAVDSARSSLEEAMSLGDRLLEAYHESRHRPSAGDVPNDERPEPRNPR